MLTWYKEFLFLQKKNKVDALEEKVIKECNKINTKINNFEEAFKQQRIKERRTKLA